MDFTGAFKKLGDKVEGWIEEIILLLPNLLAALFVVVLFLIIARTARRLTVTVLSRVVASIQIRNLLATLAYIVALVTGAFVALGVLGLDKTVTSLLAGAGILGLALAIAMQDLAANFVSGVMISIRRPFRIGDIIETNDFFGTVTAVDLRSMELRTPQGQIVLIPNKTVFENPITNFTRTGERRIDLEVGVSYAEDLATARRVAVEAVSGVSSRLPDREVELFYQEFGDSSIDFVVRFWIRFGRQAEFQAARSEAIERVKAAFDEAGITIPFPIRTLDFGSASGARPEQIARIPVQPQPDRAGNRDSD